MVATVEELEARLANAERALAMQNGVGLRGPITNVTPRSGDLLKQGFNLYRQAAGAGKTLTAWLEDEDPSAQYRDGLDSFERLLKVANIKTNSDMERGIYADHFESFMKDDSTAALVPEFFSRVWRKVRYGNRNKRSIYTSADQPSGSVLQPYIDDAAARYMQLAPAVPLAELVAMTTPIPNDSYRAFYLTDDATQERLVAVSQGAELPRAKLGGGDHVIRLRKYGRAIEITYEELRRQRIDLVALQVARIAIQSEIDKVAAALNVLINGDGNANTGAIASNLTALDAGAAAGTLTLRGWLNFKLQFPPPYVGTTMLAQTAMVLQTMLLNTGTANIPLIFIAGAGGFGQLAPINPQLADGLRVGWTTAAPSNQIVVFDNRLALQHLIEIGGDVSEVERWATRQTQVLTLSEVEGFAIFDHNATHVLNVNS